MKSLQRSFMNENTRIISDFTNNNIVTTTTPVEKVCLLNDITDETTMCHNTFTASTGMVINNIAMIWAISRKLSKCLTGSNGLEIEVIGQSS